MSRRYGKKARLGTTRPSGADAADVFGTELDDLAGQIDPNITKTPLFERTTPRVPAAQPNTANYSENELQLNDRLTHANDRLDDHRTWLRILGSILVLLGILLLLLIAAFIVMSILTANGTIGPSYPCIECVGNRLVVNGGLTVNGGTVVINVPTHLNNVTYVNQLMLLNTTSDVYFNLFTFLSNLNNTGGGNGTLSCAHCAPNRLRYR